MDKNEKEVIVFYDGTCPFCVASARNLKKLDWFNKLKIINLFTPGILEKYDIPLEKAMNRIQVVKNHTIFREGMEALLLISTYLPVPFSGCPLNWDSDPKYMIGLPEIVSCFQCQVIVQFLIQKTRIRRILDIAFISNILIINVRSNGESNFGLRGEQLLVLDPQT